MDCIELIEKVYSIYTYCNELNDSFIRYKNHAKYLQDIAQQLDSIYKLSENQKLLFEKEKKHEYLKDKEKNNSNYKNELESSFPPVIINFYNYTKKFMGHVKKIKKKNFVERLWYLSVNDEKMDGLEEELNFIMKQFQIDTFSLLHTYIKEQKDNNITNKDISSIPQPQASVIIKEKNEDIDNINDQKIRKIEKEMKKKTKEMNKREYELVKELEMLRKQNEKERKKRRELEKMQEYQYYKDILENDEKLYKKMLVRVPLSSTQTKSTSSSSSHATMSRTVSKSQNFNTTDLQENSPVIIKMKKNMAESGSRSFSKLNISDSNDIPVENKEKEKSMPYMTEDTEEKTKINNQQPKSAIIDVFKKNEYEYIVKTMSMVNHSQTNPKLYELALKLLGYMKRKSKVANETKALPSWFVDETNMDVLDDKNAFIGSGSYCHVQKCIYNGALVAKKTLNIDPSEYKKTNINSPNGSNIASFTERDWFLREIEIWCKIKSHPNVLQFYGACHISQHPSIISEYCSKGTVKTYTSQKNVSPEQKLQIMHGIITGLYHLHQNNIIHGDIKSDNILISESGKPKICDFGLSIIKTDSR